MYMSHTYLVYAMWSFKCLIQVIQIPCTFHACKGHAEAIQISYIDYVQSFYKQYTGRV